MATLCSIHYGTLLIVLTYHDEICYMYCTHVNGEKSCNHEQPCHLSLYFLLSIKIN